jgi:cytochrome c-type biogenesis protein CcmH
VKRSPRGYAGWIAIAWLLAICALALAAYGTPTSAQSLDDRTRAIAQELRCPVCQGESVADSSSGISQAMRGIIRQQLASGHSAGQIKAYFVSKYGTWILLAPPSSGIGALAWLAPPLLAVGGLAVLVTLVADWRKRGRKKRGAAKSEYLERVRMELAAEWVRPHDADGNE